VIIFYILFRRRTGCFNTQNTPASYGLGNECDEHQLVIRRRRLLLLLLLMMMMITAQMRRVAGLVNCT